VSRLHPSTFQQDLKQKMGNLSRSIQDETDEESQHHKQEEVEDEYQPEEG
jgi:hypothetical protein